MNMIKRASRRIGAFGVLAFVTLFASKTHATVINVGIIDLTGDFTLNHTFNFNHKEASPFGTFASLTVQNATGIFGAQVATGAVLAMNAPFMYVSTGYDPVPLPAGGTIYGTLPQPMLWNIGGFSFNTLWDNVAGADGGRSCYGFVDLSGNGFNPNIYPVYPYCAWGFTAPPYDISNFPADVTGKISMRIAAYYDDGVRVPDGGETFLLLAFGASGIAAIRFRSTRR